MLNLWEASTGCVEYVEKNPDGLISKLMPTWEIAKSEENTIQVQEMLLAMRSF